MPVEYGPHQPGDRLPGHTEEVWAPWLCTTCNGTHESDPRQGCPGFKATKPQMTLEQMQGTEVHGAVLTQDGQSLRSPERQALRDMRLTALKEESSLAARLAAAQSTPAASPVLLDSIRMIVREELQQKAAPFSPRERAVVAEGLKLMRALLTQHGRQAEDPSDEEMQALIQRMEE